MNIKNIKIIKLIGNTNVGKSTLFNKIFCKKISITAKKKNLTINEIYQKYNNDNNEIIYIDTPGINIYKNLIEDNINIINFIIEINKISLKEINIINQFKNKIPLIIVINKIDKYKYEDIFKFINYIKDKIYFTEIVPISAKNNINIKKLKLINEKIILNNNNIIKKNIHNIQNTFDFKKNSIKIIKEITREKFFRFLGDELPYQIKDINISEINKKIYIDIYLKKKNIKKIFIGKNGNKIKQISFNIENDINKIFKKKINIIIFIK